MDDILRLLNSHCDAVDLVGSRVTCDPPPTDTDQDVLCLCREKSWPALIGRLEQEGWTFDGSEEYANSLDTGKGFQSYRNGDVNLILTTDETFHRLFLVGTGLAKRFNLLAKQDRIDLFQAVIYSNGCASWSGR